MDNEVLRKLVAELGLGELNDELIEKALKSFARRKTKYPASLLCDFYKISHRPQYPKKTDIIYATWTPRASRMSGVNHVIAVGMQGFAKEYLIDYFDEHFFSRSEADIVNEYVRVIRYTLGEENPDASHLIALHKLGYLPLEIRAVKEGTKVPLRVPMVTIENTIPEFFWLTNYIETLWSCEDWQIITSATIANEYRALLDHYAELTGGDLSFIPFQGHDFSMRGMGGLFSAIKSGAGHLSSFTGTDTIPSILFHEHYYNAHIETELVGTSIPATEHSVQCAGGLDEMQTYKRLITEVYPKGFISIVSDTWDLWKVITQVVYGLKKEIMARDGRVVIRPDSGDPVKIIVGDSESEDINVRKGVIELLWDIFGGTINSKGYKVLDPHIGAIYGDAITLARAEAICKGLMAKGFCTTNIVFGIGSFTYQYNTRDTFGFALKTTYAKIDGVEQFLFKDPITDKDAIKKSLCGLVVVLQDADGELYSKDHLYLADREAYQGQDQLEVMFRNGKIIRDEKLSDIRERIKGYRIKDALKLRAS